jgi:hypothetical protein
MPLFYLSSAFNAALLVLFMQLMLSGPLQLRTLPARLSYLELDVSTRPSTHTRTRRRCEGEGLCKGEEILVDKQDNPPLSAYISCSGPLVHKLSIYL